MVLGQGKKEHTSNRLPDFKSALSSALEKLERDRAVVLGAVLPGDVQRLTSDEGLVFGGDSDAVEAFGLRKGGADESYEGGDGGDGELHLDLLRCLFVCVRSDRSSPNLNADGGAQY